MRRATTSAGSSSCSPATSSRGSAPAPPADGPTWAESGRDEQGRAHPRLSGWLARHTRSVDAAVASTLLSVTVVPCFLFAALDVTGVAAGGTLTILSSLMVSLLSVPLLWRRAQAVRAAAVVIASEAGFTAPGGAPRA